VNASNATDEEVSHGSGQSHSSSEEGTLTSKSSVTTLGPLDYATPLTIQTSPAPSTSGTDTSSEIGSAFNSPTQTWNWGAQQQQPSPSSRDLKRFVVIRMTEQDEEQNCKKTSMLLFLGF
jgi:hypothetical protein